MSFIASQSSIGQNSSCDLVQTTHLHLEISRTNTPIIDVLDNLKEALLQRRSTFMGEIVPKFGHMSLYEYSESIFKTAIHPNFRSRQEHLARITRDVLSERLGEKVANQVSKQLLEKPVVSTSDHHGTINHPMPINANLICGLPYVENQNSDEDSLIVFTFGGVSSNNFLAYARGIEFHDGEKNEQLIRVPILPDKLKMGVVYGLPGFTQEHLLKAKKELANKQREGLVSAERAGMIAQILDEVFGSEEILATPDLSSQITKINYALWPKLFHSSTGVAEASKVPNLIYVEIETIVTQLLLQCDLKNPESILYKLLFDPSCQRTVLQYFNDLPGGFSLEKNTGSYLFWSIDEKYRREALILKDGLLQTKDGSWSCKMDPESLSAALESKKIFPGMLLSYLVIGLFYGIKCLGGFCQVYDLSVLKDSWGKLLKEIGQMEELAMVETVDTKTFSADGLILAYLQNNAGNFVPATGIDLITTNMDTRYERFLELSKQVRFSDMVYPTLPDMYRVLYHQDERDQSLLQFSSEEIIRATGLDKKLKNLHS